MTSLLILARFSAQSVSITPISGRSTLRMKPFSCQNSRIWGHSFRRALDDEPTLGAGAFHAHLVNADWGGATTTGWAAAGLVQPPATPLGAVGGEGGPPGATSGTA